MDNSTDVVINLDVLPVEKGVKRAEKSLQSFQRTIERQNNAHKNKLEQQENKHLLQLAQIARKEQAQLLAIRERGHQQLLAQARRHQQQMKTATGSGIGARAGAYAGIAATAGVAGAFAFGRAAVDSFKEYDKLIQQLRASEGSIDKARSKYAQLFAEGQKLVGLTGRDLVESYAFLKNSLDGSTQSSEALAKSFGKVRALFSEFDPKRAAGNIRQLVTERFQIQDLREMENQAPGFQKGLLSEFGVKNVEELRKKLVQLNPTISEIQNRLSNVFTGLGAQTDNFTTKISKLASSFREALVPAGQWLGSIGLQIINQLSPAFSDLGSRVGGFFEKIAPSLRLSLTTGVEFFKKMIEGFNAFEERFSVFDNLASMFNRFFNATSLLNSGFIGVAGIIRSALGGAIDWLQNKLSSMYGTLASAFELVGMESYAKTFRKAEIGMRTYGGSNAALPSTAGSIAPVDNTGARYLDFGGAGGSKSGKSQAQKDRESRQSLIESGRQSREAMTKALNARDDAAFLSARMDSQRLSRVSMTLGSDALLDDRMTSQRLSRVSQTQGQDYREETIKKQMEALEDLKPVLTSSQSFMKGLRGEVDQSSQAFLRFGDSLGQAFGDVRNLYDGLKSAIRGFLNDITSSVLRSVASAALSPLGMFSTGGANRGGQAAGIGNFLTPGFAGGSGGSFAASGAGSILQNQQMMQLLSGSGSRSIGGLPIGNVPFGVPMNKGGIGGFFGGIGSSLKSTFSSPLMAGAIGASFGGMLGGQSTAGNILGAAGGGLLSAGLGGLMTGSMALATAGPLAAIGVPLLIGSILLGKAKQRRADESQVDTYWVEYRRVVQEAYNAVESDQMLGADAIAQAREARETAVGLIGQIKTKSVRDSRMNNQIPQIDRWAFPLLEGARDRQQQRQLVDSASLKRRGDLDSRLVAEFSSGGEIRGAYGSRQALMGHAGEVILNAAQRARIGDDALANAGVPGMRGGSGSGMRGSNPDVNLNISIGKQDATLITVNGLESPAVSKVFTNQLKTALYRG